MLRSFRSPPATAPARDGIPAARGVGNTSSTRRERVELVARARRSRTASRMPTISTCATTGASGPGRAQARSAAVLGELEEDVQGGAVDEHDAIQVDRRGAVRRVPQLAVAPRARGRSSGRARPTSDATIPRRRSRPLQLVGGHRPPSIVACSRSSRNRRFGRAATRGMRPDDARTPHEPGTRARFGSTSSGRSRASRSSSSTGTQTSHGAPELRERLVRQWTPVPRRSWSTSRNVVARLDGARSASRRRKELRDHDGESSSSCPGRRSGASSRSRFSTRFSRSQRRAQRRSLPCPRELPRFVERCVNRHDRVECGDLEHAQDAGVGGDDGDSDAFRAALRSHACRRSRGRCRRPGRRRPSGRSMADPSASSNEPALAMSSSPSTRTTTQPSSLSISTAKSRDVPHWLECRR